MIPEEEKHFFKKRAKMIRLWKFAGIPMILLWCGLYLYFYIDTPFLVNPMAVKEKILEQGADLTLVYTLAILAPALMLVIFFLLLILLLFAFVALSNEKKYLKTLERLGLL